jgi:F-type H+-transporting ATPase subunit b
MPDVEATAHTESVPGVPAPLQKLSADVMQVSDTMILLTWLVFGAAAFCLHKLLWKPILGAVASREKSIADALDGADRARKELAESETRGRELLDRASEESRAVAERAAREAEAAVARADQEAKRAARRRVEEAEQAIAAEQRKATEAVRLDAARQLGETIERLLRQNLTDEQKRAYQAVMLNEVKV